MIYLYIVVCVLLYLLQQIAFVRPEDNLVWLVYMDNMPIGYTDSRPWPNRHVPIIMLHNHTTNYLVPV